MFQFAVVKSGQVGRSSTLRYVEINAGCGVEDWQ